MRVIEFGLKIDFYLILWRGINNERIVCGCRILGFFGLLFWFYFDFWWKYFD